MRLEGLSAATPSPPSTLMSVTITLAPSSPKRLAIAAPKPDPPPIENDVLDGSWLSCGGGLLTGDDGNFALESCALRHCVWLLR
jgi:hypothetical protein